MNSQPNDRSELEEALRTLVLKAYADGASVEGEWTIESIPEEIPDWEIVISQSSLGDPEADVDVQIDH